MGIIRLIAWAIAALVPAAEAFRCGSLLRRPAALGRHRTAALLSEAGSTDDGSFEAELRKALSGLPPEELKESDRRLMDDLVEERSKGEFSAFTSSFDRDLQSVQGAIEQRLEETTRKLEDDTMARIDAAVEALRRGDARASGGAAPAGAAASGNEAAPDFSAELPADALVVVAGGGTPLGRELLRVLGSSSEWQLRSLELDGSGPSSEGVDTRKLTPFAPTALKKDLAGAAAVVVVSAAVAGKGGVENEAVGRLVKALGGDLRRLIFVSQHGTLRATELPFNLRNLFGQLDKLRAAEQEVVLKAQRDLPAHAVLRLGKLTEGGAGARGRVELAPGDAFDAPCCLSAAARTVAATLRRPETVNATFSAAQPSESPGDVMADAEWWDDEYLKLVGPEVLRVPLRQLSASEAVGFVREWSRGLLRPGRGLTTPIEVEEVEGGALLRFLKGAGSGYDDVDAQAEEEDPWRKKGAGAALAKAQARDKPDGALLLVAEASPFARVRVCRAEMGPGVVVKEMSEAAVLSRLQKDLAEVEAARKAR